MGDFSTPLPSHRQNADVTFVSRLTNKLPILLAGLALLVAASVLMVLRQAPGTAHEPPPVTSLPSHPSKTHGAAASSEPAPPAVAASAPVAPTTHSSQETSGSDESEDKKFAVLESLREASALYSPEGIPLIEPSLYSADKDIRQAAAEAMVILGETSGAEVLRKAAAKTQDPREASALLDKAEYLELPPARLLLKPKNSRPSK